MDAKVLLRTSYIVGLVENSSIVFNRNNRFVTDPIVSISIDDLGNVTVFAKDLHSGEYMVVGSVSRRGAVNISINHMGVA